MLQLVFLCIQISGYVRNVCTGQKENLHLLLYLQNTILGAPSLGTLWEFLLLPSPRNREILQGRRKKKTLFMSPSAFLVSQHPPDRLLDESGLQGHWARSTTSNVILRVHGAPHDALCNRNNSLRGFSHCCWAFWGIAQSAAGAAIMSMATPSPCQLSWLVQVHKSG